MQSTTGSTQNGPNQGAQQTSKGSASTQQKSEQDLTQSDKVLITGDDILIEYVDRLINQLRVKTGGAALVDPWSKPIEKFITHYVWHSQDQTKGEDPGLGLVGRLEGRLHEM